MNAANTTRIPTAISNGFGEPGVGLVDKGSIATNVFGIAKSTHWIGLTITPIANSNIAYRA